MTAAARVSGCECDCMCEYGAGVWRPGHAVTTDNAQPTAPLLLFTCGEIAHPCGAFVYLPVAYVYMCTVTFCVAAVCVHVRLVADPRRVGLRARRQGPARAAHRAEQRPHGAEVHLMDGHVAPRAWAEAVRVAGPRLRRGARLGRPEGAEVLGVAEVLPSGKARGSLDVDDAAPLDGSRRPPLPQLARLVASVGPQLHDG